MFPNKQQIRARTERVGQAQHQFMLSQRRWRGSLTGSAATPKGLAVGFALGFGIGYFLKAPPGEQIRSAVTLPGLLSTVRALLLAQ